MEIIMISSKKFDLIAILLIALVLIGTVYAMFLPQSEITSRSSGTLSYSEIHAVTLREDDYYTAYADDSAVNIYLKGDYAESSSQNVKIDEGNITILGGGVYVLSGTLEDGSLIVDSADNSEVRLVLNNVNIASSDFSAVYIKQAGKTVISLVPDTENSFSDGSSYSEEKSEGGKPTAALYSKDDLTINGTGKLSVNGNYLDAIKANDALIITECTIAINAVDDGINANDCIAAVDADLAITSGGDAIKCEHEDESKGFIAFESASLSVSSEGDGIYASSALYINNTSAQITSGGGSENASAQGGGFGGDMDARGYSPASSADLTSAKAIKAGANIVINGGSFTLDSSDDSLHSDGDLTIEGGAFVISSGDDGVHAEKNLIINPESISITKCYEGLEGAYITVNGGDISIISSDDGINATGEGSAGGGGMMMGAYGGEVKDSEEDIWLTVNGGRIYIETSGDGLDSNGSAVINEGRVEIYGPENGGNASIDIGDGGYALIMNGGNLLAAGNSAMADSPSESSAQQSLVFYLENACLSGSSIQVTDSSGNEIISGTSSKNFNWVCISAPTLTENETYTLLIDGNIVSELTANGSLATAGNKSGGMDASGGVGGRGGSERR